MTGMLVRILLSLAMLVPAAPAEDDTRGCPFTTVEECQAWLRACCPEFAQSEAASPEPCASEATCCKSETQCTAASSSADAEPTEGCCGSRSEAAVEEADACCASSSACGADQNRASDCSSAGETQRACGGGAPCDSSTRCADPTSKAPCEWCCCCPLRPLRGPEPQPTPVTQRSSSEKATPDKAAPTRLESPNLTRDLIPRLRSETATSFDSRQSVLCIWRE